MRLPAAVRRVSGTAILILIYATSVIAASVALVVDSFNQERIDGAMSQITEGASRTVEARQVLDDLIEILPPLAKSSLNLTQSERESGLRQTDLHLRALYFSMQAYRPMLVRVLPHAKLRELESRISDVFDSWKEFRSQQRQIASPQEMTFHFLVIIKNLKETRRIVAEIERSALAANEESFRDVLASVRQRDLLMIATLMISLMLGLVAVAANYRSARRAKTINARLQAALANMRHGISMYDRDARLVIANQRYIEMYDLLPEHARPGTHFSDVIARRARSGLLAANSDGDFVASRMKIVAEGKSSSHIHRLESGRYYEVIFHPLADGGFLATHEDITDRQIAAEALRDHSTRLEHHVAAATAELNVKARELEQALDRERELNEVQRQFVSMASHEFRTPLAIIDATAQGLKRRIARLSEAEVVDRIGKIREAVARMVQLMESVLSAARMEAGRITIEPRNCDVARLVRQACARQQDVASSHRFNLAIENLPATMRADPSALDQILTNLLSNAVKYAPGAPDIDVTARGMDEVIVISVRDSGVGIDEGELPRMFERFFRASTSTGIAGTGIGLNLTKMLVEMHGGSIEVESHAGKGSTFTVRLPLAGPAQADPGALAQPESAAA